MRVTAPVVRDRRPVPPLLKKVVRTPAMPGQEVAGRWRPLQAIPALVLRATKPRRPVARRTALIARPLLGAIRRPQAVFAPRTKRVPVGLSLARSVAKATKSTTKARAEALRGRALSTRPADSSAASCAFVGPVAPGCFAPSLAGSGLNPPDLRFARPGPRLLV